MSIALMTSLFEYKAWADAELFAALKGLSEPELAQFADKQHRATRLFNHIYVVDQIFAAHLSGQKHSFGATNTPETPTLEALQKAFVVSDAWFLNYVKNLSAEDLSEKVAFEFTDGDKGQMTREEVLTHIINHGSYHRGAIGEILVQCSLTAPTDILTRFLHSSDASRRRSTL